MTVDALEQDDDGVDVTLTDGSSGRYDLVIGADGINSLVRGRVFGDAPEPEYTGQVVWRHNFPKPPEQDTLDTFVGVRGKAGLVPLAPDLMYMFVIERWPGDDLDVPEERLAETLRERLAGYGGIIGELRDTQITEQSEIVYRPVYSLLVPLAVVSRARRARRGRGPRDLAPRRPGRRDGDRGRRGARRGGRVVRRSRQARSSASWTRRFDRCKRIWEISRQLGTWEIEEARDADFVGLTIESVQLTAAPI